MSSNSDAYESDILSLPDAAPNLINHELAPLKRQTWGTYNIFCYWMSDVHSVGGYVFAGSLFALGLASWWQDPRHFRNGARGTSPGASSARIRNEDSLLQHF